MARRVPNCAQGADSADFPESDSPNGAQALRELHRDFRSAGISSLKSYQRSYHFLSVLIFDRVVATLSEL